MTNVLITICGRAGSKGFKNKNLKVFLQYPLVYYSLSAAFLFCDKVKEEYEVDLCLNTDSAELAEIVQLNYPEVELINRPKELAEGSVPKSVVWNHCLDYMDEHKNKHYKYLIDLDITSPLRKKDDVMNAFNLILNREDCDMVESVCKSRRNPYFNMVEIRNGYLKTVIDNDYTARQQAPIIYDENASIYVLNTRVFENNRTSRVNRTKRLAYEMQDTAVLDIDSEDDFILMEVIANYLYEKDNNYCVIRDNIRK